ncbi:MAG: molybdenum cofactor biosynthesis protein MoaE [Chthoniobacterales bacterium]
MDFCEILITREAIAVPSATGFAHGCGAVVDFFGVVRPLEEDRPLAGIDYEAHPRMAERELRAIVEESSKNPALRGCLLVHRVGFVPAGEISLFLRVATPHRQAGYDLSREIVEALKQRAPIWKQPIFAA